MNNLFLLPAILLKFWYLEAPISIAGYFGSFNAYVMQLFALPLCIRTFFKPLKNEYRQGLVGFSIGMGIFIKSVLIFTDIIILAGLLLFELAIVISFLLFPPTTIFLLFL